MNIRAVSKLHVGPISLVEFNLQTDRRNCVQINVKIAPPKSNNNGEQDN